MATTFSMVSGDTKTITIPIVDSAGDPVDVSSAASATFVIANQYTYAVLATKTLADGVSISTSTVTVALAPADTAALAGNYRIELQIVDGDGNVFTPLQGTVTIARDAIV